MLRGAEFPPTHRLPGAHTQAGVVLTFAVTFLGEDTILNVEQGGGVGLE